LYGKFILPFISEREYVDFDNFLEKKFGNTFLRGGFRIRVRYKNFKIFINGRILAYPVIFEK
jgi:hypothetical protein